MLCPHCGASLVDSVCPRCSTDTRAATVASGSSPLVFDNRVRSPRQEETAARWQQELRRRLASRSAEETGPGVEPAVARDNPAPGQPEAAPGAPFQYEMKPASAGSYPRPVRAAEPAIADRQLLRASQPAREAATDPAQGTLVLEAPAQLATVPESAPEPEDALIDREILFSRFLCGMIDLSLPILTGFLFTIAGSWVLNFDYFLSAALEWAAAFSLFFFFFNSLFFLLLMGQTPGMYITELKLVGEDGTNPPTVSQVVLRVLMFLPSTASGLGLAWSLKDPLCRTLHDRWSGTRVDLLD